MGQDRIERSRTPDLQAMLDWWVAEHERVREEYKRWSREVMVLPGHVTGKLLVRGDAVKRDYRATELAMNYLARAMADTRKSQGEMPLEAR